MTSGLKLFKITWLILAITYCFAAKAPFHKSIRALSMGNAFVAVADDKDAVYYNPAGLWYMDRMGNYKTNPELGHYPNNKFDARINIGASLPAGQTKDIINMVGEIQEAINNSQKDSTYSIINSLSENTELIDDIYSYDSKPIFIGSKLDLELAWHPENFLALGAAAWTDVGISPYLDGGIFTPSIGVDTVYADVVMQGGFAFDIKSKHLLGMSYKWSRREYLESFHVTISEWEENLEEIKQESQTILSNLNDVASIAHAVDFGYAYIYTPELRLASSLRDIYFTKLGDQRITPNFTVGLAYSPKKFQRNTSYSRKVNFAADFADIFQNENNYKFFSHINMGFEIEQVLFAVRLPKNPLSNDLRIIKLRLAAGFNGGYPTAGFSLEGFRLGAIEFATWGEENGSYTGQLEKRYYLTQISLGF